MADIAEQLGEVLNQLMLPASRGALCAPVIAAAPPGVDAQTYPLLLVLRSAGPLSPAGLAAAIGIDRSGASRHADRLAELGLATRAPDPDDRRATRVALTARGRRVIDELNEVLADHLHELSRDWPRGQAEALVGGLRSLLDGSRRGSTVVRSARPTTAPHA